METGKYRVYNQARESFLSQGVMVIDTTLEPLKLLRVMVEGLALNARTGLWLRPLTEIPKVPRLSPFDLIYLDGDGRVIQGVELLPGVNIPVFKQRAASAMILPLKTMSSSKTRPGDQLLMALAEEPAVEVSEEKEAGALSASNGRISRGEEAETKPGSPDDEIPPALSRKDDLFNRRQIAVEWQEDQEDEEEPGELEGAREESPNAPVPGGGQATEGQPEEIPMAAVPASVPKLKTPLVERSGGNGTSAKTRTGSPRGRQDSATQRPDNRPQSEGAPPKKATPLNIPPIRVENREAEKQLETTSNRIQDTPAAEPKDSAAEMMLEFGGIAPAEADEDLRSQHAAIQRFIHEAKTHSQERKSGFRRALKWLYPDPGTSNDRRRSIRLPSSELMAYYPEKGTERGHVVGNISSSGVYLVTDERWPPGTLIPLTLQRKGPLEENAGQKIRVQAGPARWGKDGIGLYFVFPTGMDLRLWESPHRRFAAETETEYILREFRTARALGFVRRICAPVVDEVERLVQKELSNYRAASAVEVALKAEALIASAPDAGGMLAHPEIVMRIIELGSWADADLLQRFWAGLLAASCSHDGQDKSNHAFIDLLSVLTLVHIRILAGACARATKVTSDRGEVSIYPIYCTADEICKMAGTNDFTKIHRSIAILSDLGLLEKSAHSSFVSYTEKAKTTPTQLGLEMCARCSGIRGEQ
jgi:hypothetical protein